MPAPTIQRRSASPAATTPQQAAEAVRGLLGRAARLDARDARAVAALHRQAMATTARLAEAGRLSPGLRVAPGDATVVVQRALAVAARQLGGM